MLFLFQRQVQSNMGRGAPGLRATQAKSGLSSSRIKALILEPHANGHHGPYLHWMASGLAERGVGVTIVTLPESMAHPSLRALVDSDAEIRVISFAGSPVQQLGQRTLGVVAREFFYWRLFRRWYKAHFDTVQPDVVFLPYLDYCLHAIGLLGSPFGDCPWVGLAMRPSFHYQAMGVVAPRPALTTIKKALFFRVLKNPQLRYLLTIDEPLMEYFGGNSRDSGKVVFLPEPAEFEVLPDAVEAKQRLGLPIGRKLILVYGAITQRKGVVELLRALADPAFPPLVDVLLAGNIADDIRHLLSESWVQSISTRGRLMLLDRFITTEEEPLLFAAADIVWLGYREHYTASGILAQAVCAGRPVLACEEGIIGWQTRRHGLGEVARIGEVSAIIARVRVLLDRSPIAFDGGGREPRAAVGGGFFTAKDILARAVIGRI